MSYIDIKSLVKDIGFSGLPSVVWHCLFPRQQRLHVTRLAGLIQLGLTAEHTWKKGMEGWSGESREKSEGWTETHTGILLFTAAGAKGREGEEGDGGGYGQFCRKEKEGMLGGREWSGCNIWVAFTESNSVPIGQWDGVPAWVQINGIPVWFCATMMLFHFDQLNLGALMTLWTARGSKANTDNSRKAHT